MKRTNFLILSSVLCLVSCISCFGLKAQIKDSLNKQLFGATKKSDLVKVKTLLDKGADVNAIDANKATVVMWAVYKSNLEMAKFLVSKGANAAKKGIISNAGGGTYGSPLIAAAGEAKTDIVKYLIEECKIQIDDPEIETDGKPGWTALQTASYNGNIETVKYLISKGANLDIKDDVGWTALHYTCQQSEIHSSQTTDNRQQYEIIKNLLLEKCKDKSGLNYKESWKFIFFKGEDFYNKGKSDSAQIYMEKALIQAEKEFGKKDINYAASLNDLGLFYTYAGNFEKAEPLLTQALKIRKNILPDNHPIIAISLNNLALLYDKMGIYLKAEPLYLETLKIYKEVLGDKDTRYALYLDNLAIFYQEVSKYPQAKQLFLEANKIYIENHKDKDPQYAFSLFGLGTLYRFMGNYQKAEPLFTESLKINKEVLGEKHPHYIANLNNLAVLYQDMGNYQKAELLFIQALKINKEVLGEKNFDYARSLNNLAFFYTKTRNYEKAEPLFLEAIKIYKEISNDKNPDYATCLNNLAGFYSDIGNYQKAEPLYLEALKIRKERFGEKHPLYAGCLGNLANLYKAMGNYSQAEPLFIESLKIFKEIFGDKHPDYANTSNNLAHLYYAMNNYNKAEPLFFAANQNLNERLNGSFNFLSEKEQQLFLNNMYGFFEQFNSFVFNYRNSTPEITEISYNNELALKGALLNEGIKLRQAIHSSGDTSLENSFNNLQSIRQELGKLYTLPLNKRFADVNKLEENANEIDKTLIQKSVAYRDIKTEMEIKWTDVQKNLKQDEAAIEFISFNYYNRRKRTDSALYCALIIRPEYKEPKMIELFEEKQLENIIQKRVQTSDKIYISQLYSSLQTPDNVSHLQNVSILSKNEGKFVVVNKPINKILKLNENII